MPQRIALYNEADTQKATTDSSTPPKMTTEYVPGMAAMGRLRKEPAICPTDDDAIVPPRPQQAQLDKKSWEYIIKSGVAGGMAGCAVRHISYTESNWGHGRVTDAYVL
jgi:hypothetical protein